MYMYIYIFGLASSADSSRVSNRQLYVGFNALVTYCMASLMVRWFQCKGSEPVRCETHQGLATALDGARCSAVQYTSSLRLGKLESIQN